MAVDDEEEEGKEKDRHEDGLWTKMMVWGDVGEDGVWMGVKTMICLQDNDKDHVIT